MPRHHSLPKLRKKVVGGHAYAVVTLRDGFGGRREVSLGHWNDPAVPLEFAKAIQEWQTRLHQLEVPQPDGNRTVNELLVLYQAHVEKHYRYPDGQPTTQQSIIACTMRPLRVLYGETPAREFGPLALRTLQTATASGSWLTEEEKAKRRLHGGRIGCCRKETNRRMNIVRTFFKWAISQELLPAAVLQALQTVPPLKRGRCDARERPGVKPVHPDVVERTLPFLSPQVATMVKLQWLCGMRPHEATEMRTCDLETSGTIWTYRPSRHKNTWREQDRVVFIGPRAQQILKPWLRTNLEEFLFQPQEAMEWKRQQQRQQRKSKVQPSQLSRKKRRPRKKPGAKYTTLSYNQAIREACKKAQAPTWTPLQLRHLRGTEVRKIFGLEGAQVTLGHKHAQVTEVYAEKNHELAAQIALKLG